MSRIKELAERAGMWSFTEITRSLEKVEFDVYDKFNHEKFAQLIIQECLDILNHNNPRPPGTQILYSNEQDKHFDTGWQVAIESKAVRIKRHFEVKK